MGERAWFAPKTNGIGASWPIRWEGWATLAIFVAGMVLAGTFLQGWERALAFLALAAAFTIICWKTTAGGWRLRP